MPELIKFRLWLDEINAELEELTKRRQELDLEREKRRQELDSEFQRGREELEHQRAALEKMRDIASAQLKTAGRVTNRVGQHQPEGVSQAATNAATTGSPVVRIGITDGIRNILQQEAGGYLTPTQVRDRLLPLGYQSHEHLLTVVHNTLKRLLQKREAISRKVGGKTGYAMKREPN